MEKSSCFLVGKTPFVVIVSFSPMGFSAAIVSIKGCNALRGCFTQCVLPYQLGAGEVLQMLSLDFGLFSGY